MIKNSAGGQSIIKNSAHEKSGQILCAESHVH